MPSGGPIRFRFTLLGSYDAHLRGNEPHVTVNLLGGRGDHLVYCGNFTMSEAEWKVFSEALTRSLGDDVEIDDHRIR